MPTGKPAMFTDFEAAAIREAHRQGWSERDIAYAFGKPKTTVHRFLHKPLPERPEDVEIIFPVNAYTPRTCGHVGPIPTGDQVYCPTCDKTGIDHHPKLVKPRKKPASRKEPAKFVPKGQKTA